MVVLQRLTSHGMIWLRKRSDHEAIHFPDITKRFCECWPRAEAIMV